MTRRIVCPGLILALLFLSAGSPTFGQSVAVPSRVEQLLESARELRRSNRPDEAIHVCLKALQLDRGNGDVLSELRQAVRQAMQAQRHREPGFQSRLLAMSQADVLALYGEVLTKLQEHYVDGDRVSAARLFRQGLDEYLAALSDPHFQERFLKQVDENVLSRFRATLQKAWRDRDIGTVRQALEVTAEIAAVSKRTLGLRSINPVVGEFICGACNSLDEYSAYLSPGQYLAETAVAAGATVQMRIEDGGVAYLQITSLQPTTPAEIDAILKNLTMMGSVRALILDLRGNSGGLLSAAVQVAERFLPAGIIVTTQGQHEDETKVYTSSAGDAASLLPMVVLIDAATASAAEVLACALRDHQRAVLIGTATFGKGSVQRILAFTTAEEVDPATGKMRPRAAIRLTTARLIAPSGHPISGVGVAPDKVIPDRDRQTEAALELARDLARRTPGGLGFMAPMRD